VAESITSLADVRMHRGGWSHNELTHLHRAARPMRASGFCIESACGVTDEGEPWFVYCDVMTGEIIAHFARINGSYVACSPFRSGAMKGRNFPDLIERFLQRHVRMRNVWPPAA